MPTFLCYRVWLTFITLSCAFTGNIFCAEDGRAPNAASLPKDLAALVTSYEADVAKLKADTDKSIAAKAEVLRGKLVKAQEDMTKKGDLDTAVAIKQAIESLDGNKPIAKVGSAEKLKKTWAKGVWQVVWPGFRANITFSPDGTMVRQDGAKGTYTVGDGSEAVDMVWDDGAEWTVQPPDKGDPSRTLGRNNKSHGSFTLTKQP